MEISRHSIIICVVHVRRTGASERGIRLRGQLSIVNQESEKSCKDFCFFGGTMGKWSEITAWWKKRWMWRRRRMTAEKETRDEFHRCLPNYPKSICRRFRFSSSSFLPDQIGMFSSSRHLPRRKTTFRDNVNASDDFDLPIQASWSSSIPYSLWWPQLWIVNDSGGSDCDISFPAILNVHSVSLFFSI